MPQPTSARRRRPASAALVLLGLAMAAAGGLLLYLTLRSADAVALGDPLREEGVNPSAAERVAAIARLEALPRRRANEEDALAFLHYAAADAAARRRDAALRRRELISAREAARATLRQSPERAEAALALAEIDYLLGAPRRQIERALMLSYETAPRELWIAERRIGLGLQLAAAAPPELEARIESDIRFLGEPFRSTENYRVLARAADRAGPAAVELVRDVLARGHPWPFQIFNQDLERLRGAGEVRR